jgi:hypothetical protein
MVESNEDGFSAMVVGLIADLSPESSVTIKYIVGLVTSLGKPALATCSHVTPELYCPYNYQLLKKTKIIGSLHFGAVEALSPY